LLLGTSHDEPTKFNISGDITTALCERCGIHHTGYSLSIDTDVIMLWYFHDCEPLASPARAALLVLGQLPVGRRFAVQQVL
jgi:hypothetical protein